MDASDWIALAALTVSVTTAVYAWRRGLAAARRADVTAFLNWLPARAYLKVGESDITVGYHLVLWNRGPARATNVSVSVHTAEHPHKHVRLTDVRADEFPLSSLDPGARYPIPWALGEDGLESKDERRFLLKLTWSDSTDHAIEIPIRRGNAGA